MFDKVLALIRKNYSESFRVAFVYCGDRQPNRDRRNYVGSPLEASSIIALQIIAYHSHIECIY